MICHKCGSSSTKQYLNINPNQSLSSEEIRKLDLINFTVISSENPNEKYLYQCNSCGFTAIEHTAQVTFKYSIKSFDVINGLEFLLDKYEVQPTIKKSLMADFSEMFSGQRKRISTEKPNTYGKNKIVQMYDELRPNYKKNIDAYKEIKTKTGLEISYIKNTITSNKKKVPNRPK